MAGLLVVGNRRTDRHDASVIQRCDLATRKAAWRINARARTFLIHRSARTHVIRSIERFENLQQLFIILPSDFVDHPAFIFLDRISAGASRTPSRKPGQIDDADRPNRLADVPGQRALQVGLDCRLACAGRRATFRICHGIRPLKVTGSIHARGRDRNCS
jgi:hypothetical protein